MQMGGVDVPDEVVKAIAAKMAGSGGVQLPGLGAIMKHDDGQADGFQLPPARKTIAVPLPLGSAARIVTSRQTS